MPTKVNAPRQRRPSADEQHVLEHRTVRPIAPHEAERFAERIVQRHYRHAHLELVSAGNGQGRWLGPGAVPEGRNEIPTARQLLTQVSVQHKPTLADALHTQLETAQPILFAGGGDYALSGKANPKQLVQTLTPLLTPGKFSPSAHATGPRVDPGTQLQPAGTPPPGGPGSHA